MEHPQQCHLTHCYQIVTESCLHFILLCQVALTVVWLWTLKQKMSMGVVFFIVHCIAGYVPHPMNSLWLPSHLFKESPLVFIRPQPSSCGRWATNWVKTQRQLNNICLIPWQSRALLRCLHDLFTAGFDFFQICKDKIVLHCLPPSFLKNNLIGVLPLYKALNPRKKFQSYSRHSCPR